jgi:hypothetical protein
VYRREGASPPLQIQPPLKQTGKRALKKDLFERGPGGEHLIATKTKQNQPDSILCIISMIYF